MSLYLITASCLYFSQVFIFSVTQSVSSPAAECAPAAEQPFHFPQPHTTMPPDKWPCAGQSAASAVGAACYNAPQDANNRTDEAALLSQLMEMPLWDMLEFQTDMEVNLGPYTQDFSQYSDLQFNMLVNENQGLQPEPQDGLANEVQVKKEEALWGGDHVASSMCSVPFCKGIVFLGKCADSLSCQV